MDNVMKFRIGDVVKIPDNDIVKNEYRGKLGMINSFDPMWNCYYVDIDGESVCCETEILIPVSNSFIYIRNLDEND